MRKTDPRRTDPFTAALLACLLAGLLPASQSVAKPPAPSVVYGISIDVQDGDSFVMRDDLGNRIRVRISGIDAPEKSQAFADRSRQHLRDFMRDARIRLEPVKVDVFARTVARVWVLSDDDKPARDVGLAQIEAGLAWHFKRYRSDQHDQDSARYAKAERVARSEGLGLWRDPNPQAPWDFRTRAKRNDQAETKNSRSAVD
jgi:endonuclease YncB( thermonuclease family)